MNLRSIIECGVYRDFSFKPAWTGSKHQTAWIAIGVFCSTRKGRFSRVFVDMRCWVCCYPIFKIICPYECHIKETHNFFSYQNSIVRATYNDSDTILTSKEIKTLLIPFWLIFPIEKSCCDLLIVYEESQFLATNFLVFSCLTCFHWIYLLRSYFFFLGTENIIKFNLFLICFLYFISTSSCCWELVLVLTVKTIAVETSF